MVNIHPVWVVCLSVRFSLIYLIPFLLDNYANLAGFLLLAISFGFLYKSITGSNNEKQLARVFWHESRLAHACLYGLAAFYAFSASKWKKSACMIRIVLFVDIVFSVLFRLCVN